MGFSTTKDPTFAVYDKVSGWIARRPAPLRRMAYGVFGGILWVAYALPGNLVRPTMTALARHADLLRPPECSAASCANSSLAPI